jgi:hypothetical protein
MPKVVVTEEDKGEARYLFRNVLDRNFLITDTRTEEQIVSDEAYKIAVARIAQRNQYQ